MIKIFNWGKGRLWVLISVAVLHILSFRRRSLSEYPRCVIPKLLGKNAFRYS